MPCATRRNRPASSQIRLKAGSDRTLLNRAATALGSLDPNAPGPIPSAEVASCSSSTSFPASATARLNEVAVDVRLRDVLRDELPETDLVVANIELAAVEQLLGRITARTAVTSGYLAHETPSAPGWERTTRLELEGWAADVLGAL